MNPFTRELIYKGLVTVADNMILTVVRTSRSTVVKNNLDFSTSVCDGDGRLVAQGLALPVHLGATMPALRGCLDHFGDDVQPGDIFANNDPYSGASHLNDVFMFKPVYKDGERIAFLSIILHHTDMGGRVPGGNAPDSTEIFQEGLRIPPAKIVERGEPNATLLRLIEANVRVPDKVLGDVRSQIAALGAGERQLLEQLEAYAAEEIRASMTDQLDYAERLTRAGIEDLPDGIAEFTDWNDDDGAGGGPVRIQVRLTVAGDEIEVDFTGTSPQTSGALNPNYWFTVSCAYAAIRACLDPAIPNNAGFYRPIRVIAPEGSFVNPRFPAPVGARGQSGYRCRTAVLGALAKLMPGRIPACPGGSEFGVVFAGREGGGAPLPLSRVPQRDRARGRPGPGRTGCGPVQPRGPRQRSGRGHRGGEPAPRRELWVPSRLGRPGRASRGPRGRPPVPGACGRYADPGPLRPPAFPSLGAVRREGGNARPLHSESRPRRRGAAVEVHPDAPRRGRVPERDAGLGRVRRSAGA